MEQIGDDRALSGLRVFELSIAIAAPNCGRYLAYHGAEVVKVEAKSSPDVARMFGAAWARSPELADVFSDTGPYLPEFFAGKRSLGLELKDAAAVDVAHRLLARCDIFLTNYTPAAIARLGMSYEEVKAVKPDIVYAGMTGFGVDPEMPYYAFRAFGPNQAPLVGLDDLTGYPDQQPAGIPTISPPDYLGSLHAVMAILTALEQRDRTGNGTFLDISQLETTVALLGPYLIGQDLGMPGPERNGNRVPWAAPCGVYQCAGDERFVAITVASDDMWHAMATVLGIEQGPLGATELGTLAGRQRHHDSLDQAISAWASDRSPAEATTTLQRVGVAAYPVLDHTGVLLDPQIHDRHWYDVKPSSRFGRDVFSGHPLRMSDTEARVDRAAPNMGEDTLGILEELGYDETEIDNLLAAGSAFTDVRPEVRLERPFDRFYEALGLVGDAPEVATS